MSILMSQHIGHVKSKAHHHYEHALFYYLAHYDIFTMLKHYGIEVSHLMHVMHFF
jgi:hypothetical protein